MTEICLRTMISRGALWHTCKILKIVTSSFRNTIFKRQRHPQIRTEPSRILLWLTASVAPAVIEGTTIEDDGVSTDSKRGVDGHTSDIQSERKLLGVYADTSSRKAHRGHSAGKTGAGLWIRQNPLFRKRKIKGEPPLDKALTPLQSVQKKYQAEGNNLPGEMRAFQEQASPRVLVEWLADRNRFIELLQKLSGYNQYFSSVILMRGYSGRSGAVAQDGIEVPEPDRKADNHLRRLIQTLAAVHGFLLKILWCGMVNAKNRTSLTIVEPFQWFP